MYRRINMNLNEAKNILHENGYLMEVSTYRGIPFMFRLGSDLKRKGIKIQQFSYNHLGKKIECYNVELEGIKGVVRRTNKGIVLDIEDNKYSYPFDITLFNRDFAEASRQCAKHIFDILTKMANKKEEFDPGYKRIVGVYGDSKEDVEKFDKLFREKAFDYIKYDDVYMDDDNFVYYISIGSKKAVDAIKKIFEDEYVKEIDGEEYDEVSEKMDDLYR